MENYWQTNKSGRSSNVQPIRKTVEGNSIYLFSDEEIRKVMEDYHIRKEHDNEIEETETNEEATHCCLMHGNAEPTSCRIEVAMNSEITDQEVKATFGKGTNATSPDGISASMVDRAERDSMNRCLEIGTARGRQEYFYRNGKKKTG